MAGTWCDGKPVIYDSASNAVIPHDWTTGAVPTTALIRKYVGLLSSFLVRLHVVHLPSVRGTAPRDPHVKLMVPLLLVAPVRLTRLDLWRLGLGLGLGVRRIRSVFLSARTLSGRAVA